jgi:hypothetical protein
MPGASGGLAARKHFYLSAEVVLMPRAPGGLSFRSTLLLANISSAAWLLVFYWLLDRRRQPPAPEKLQRSCHGGAPASSEGTDAGVEADGQSAGLLTGTDVVTRCCRGLGSRNPLLNRFCGWLVDVL